MEVPHYIQYCSLQALELFLSSLSYFSSLGISCDCWATFNLSAFDLVSRMKSCSASADFEDHLLLYQECRCLFPPYSSSFLHCGCSTEPPSVSSFAVHSDLPYSTHLSTGHIAFSQTSHGASLQGLTAIW